MKRSKFTEQQIAFVLQQAEGGTRRLPEDGDQPGDVLPWKKVYGGLMPSEVRRLKHLEEDNGRPRRLVADLCLDKEMLGEVIRKKI